MFQKVLQFIFGSKFERDLKRLTPIVVEINSFEPEIQNLSNEELKRIIKCALKSRFIPQDIETELTNFKAIL